MTWPHTRRQAHERLRIIREVEAAAAGDMTGRLPWRESWAVCFGDRHGLLTALRERWDRMCPARLEELTSPERVREAERHLRRTDAGVLRILESHGLLGSPPDVGAAPPMEAA